MVEKDVLIAAPVVLGAEAAVVNRAVLVATPVELVVEADVEEAPAVLDVETAVEEEAGHVAATEVQSSERLRL